MAKLLTCRELGSLMEPSNKGRMPDQLRGFTGQGSEYDLRNIGGTCVIAVELAKRCGIDDIQMPRNKHGKGRLGGVIDLLLEKCAVAEGVHHL